MLLSLMYVSSANGQSRSDVDTRAVSSCSDVSRDSAYTRANVLSQLGKTLDKLVPEWGIDGKGFYIAGQNYLRGAFIWDLTDTLNKEITNECIALKEAHVYHFSPIRKSYSYSSIAILKSGNVKIFEAINCPERGDMLEDVILYVKDSLPSTPDKQAIIDRVKNYRNYGFYTRIDEQSEIGCK